jgi:hypothetical protein
LRNWPKKNFTWKRKKHFFSNYVARAGDFVVQDLAREAVVHPLRDAGPAGAPVRLRSKDLRLAGARIGRTSEHNIKQGRRKKSFFLEVVKKKKSFFFSMKTNLKRIKKVENLGLK